MTWTEKYKKIIWFAFFDLRSCIMFSWCITMNILLYTSEYLLCYCTLLSAFHREGWCVTLDIWCINSAMVIFHIVPGFFTFLVMTGSGLLSSPLQQWPLRPFRKGPPWGQLSSVCDSDVRSSFIHNCTLLLVVKKTSGLSCIRTFVDLESQCLSKSAWTMCLCWRKPVFCLPRNSSLTAR